MREVCVYVCVHVCVCVQCAYVCVCMYVCVCRLEQKFTSADEVGKNHLCLLGCAALKDERTKSLRQGTNISSVLTRMLQNLQKGMEIVMSVCTKQLHY